MHLNFLPAAAAAIVLALPGGASAELLPTRLKNAMAERLAAMPDVARHKWNSGASVTDDAQEAKVIEKVVASGEELGLAPELVHQVALAQIEAAKIVQSALIEQWRAQAAPAFPDIPDLATVLRPTIAEATAGIVASLPEAMPALAECAGATDLRTAPSSLEAYAGAWAVAADGVVAAAGGPTRAFCSR
jgi:chorismate mutase-like protein